MKTGKKKVKTKKEKKLLVSNQFLILDSMDNKETGKKLREVQWSHWEKYRWRLEELNTYRDITVDILLDSRVIELFIDFKFAREQS